VPFPRAVACDVESLAAGRLKPAIGSEIRSVSLWPNPAIKSWGPMRMAATQASPATLVAGSTTVVVQRYTTARMRCVAALGS